MRVLGASLVIALLGLLASAAGLRRLDRSAGPRDAHAYWTLGLVALFPAWLIAFLALLPSAPGVPPQGVAETAWIVSASAALLGVIATESRVRSAAELANDPNPARSWLLGVCALVPAWAVAFVSRAMIATMSSSPLAP